jgi:hypothetical protein
MPEGQIVPMSKTVREIVCVIMNRTRLSPAELQIYGHTD